MFSCCVLFKPFTSLFVRGFFVYLCLTNNLKTNLI
nr:MAG TPA: hypothetical protein [Caudoviricetes sp.]